jgi:predicted SnoaL-like aldol condensation-catalyzing enzyme
LQAIASDKPNPDYKFPITVSVMAEGDRVMLLTQRVAPSGKIVFLFNMFRVQGGKLAEHWDVLPAELAMPTPSVSMPHK